MTIILIIYYKVSIPPILIGLAGMAAWPSGYSVGLNHPTGTLCEFETRTGQQNIFFDVTQILKIQRPAASWVAINCKSKI